MEFKNFQAQKVGSEWALQTQGNPKLQNLRRKTLHTQTVNTLNPRFSRHAKRGVAFAITFSGSVHARSFAVLVLTHASHSISSFLWVRL